MRKHVVDHQLLCWPVTHWLLVLVLSLNTVGLISCQLLQLITTTCCLSWKLSLIKSRGNKWTVLLFSSAVPSCWSTDRRWCLNALCFYSKQSINSRFSYLNCPSLDSFSFSKSASCNCFENEFCLKERRENIFSPQSLVTKITCTFTLKLITRLNSLLMSQINSCPGVKTPPSCAQHTHAHCSHTKLLLLLCRRGVMLPPLM